MKKFTFVLLFILLSKNFYSQQPDDQIVVIGSASIEVPADIIRIGINLFFQDYEDGKIAFKQHKKAEERLIDFLKEENIPDSSITYSLLNVRSEHENCINPIRYYTNQTIAINYYNFSDYPRFQIRLMENGFSSFNQDFESSKSIEAIDQAIQKAVQQAIHKAELICKASGRKIKKINKISDTEDTEPYIVGYRTFFNKNLTQSRTDFIGIPQTIKIEKHVKVIFDLD